LYFDAPQIGIDLDPKRIQKLRQINQNHQVQRYERIIQQVERGIRLNGLRRSRLVINGQVSVGLPVGIDKVGRLHGKRKAQQHDREEDVPRQEQVDNLVNQAEL